MTNINERLAVVETQIEQILEDGRSRESTQVEMLKQLRTMQDSITNLEKEILHYKGFLGGIVFLASCIGIFIYKFAVPIVNIFSKLKGNA